MGGGAAPGVSTCGSARVISPPVRPQPRALGPRGGATSLAEPSLPRAPSEPAGRGGGPVCLLLRGLQKVALLPLLPTSLPLKNPRGPRVVMSCPRPRSILPPSPASQSPAHTVGDRAPQALGTRGLTPTGVPLLLEASLLIPTPLHCACQALTQGWWRQGLEEVPRLG